MMGYMYVSEHCGGGCHIDVDLSSIIEDLYSLELDFRKLVWSVCSLFYFSFIGLLNAPTMKFRSLLSVESCKMCKPIGELFPLGNPLRGRGSSCVKMITTLHGPISLEACKRLRTVKGYDYFY